MQMLMFSRGSGGFRVQQRCMSKWCRGAVRSYRQGEDVNRRCRGAGQVTEIMQRCRGADMQRCRGAEIQQMYRSAENLKRCSIGSEVQSRC